MIRQGKYFIEFHHDTVRPNKNYTMDPFVPMEKDGKLFGLGSNDAGGCLVSHGGLFTFLSPGKAQA
jgi:acetylornithine deacetylase